MNIAQLKLSQKKLLDNLVSRGYDIQYIKGVKFVLRLLFEHEGCFHSYEQFAEKFIRTRGYTKAWTLWSATPGRRTPSLPPLWVRWSGGPSPN